jgi:acetylornithine deacetylase/succinyl-diaminopimelate desuccinylase-like protein
MVRPMTKLWLAGLLLSAVPALAAGANDDAQVERDSREILDALLKVDTSHGKETAALRPIAARFQAAGIQTELLESAPGRGNLIARLPGSGKKKPLLLFAHIDVVPTDGQPWTSQPYVPTEKDGYLVARGVGDDKSMASAFTAIALELKRKKVPLSRDVLVVLTSDEETNSTYGVKWLLSQPKARALGITDGAVALNEGGFVLLDRAESKVEALGLGAAEKTFQSYELTVSGKGGHSSVPDPNENLVTTLSGALVKLGAYRFPGHVIPATRESLEHRAKASSAPLRQAIERTLAKGTSTMADDGILAKMPSIDALLRTTCVTTMLKASPQDNVLPTSVVATVNCRVMPDETRDATRATLAKIIADDRVVIKPMADSGEGGASPTSGEVPDAFRAVGARLFPNAAAYNMMGTGASDSRYLRAAGIAAYGVGAWPMSMEDAMAGHGAHGADERRPLKWYGQGLSYVRELVHTLAR